MSVKNPAEQIIAAMELSGEPISEEEKNEIELYQKGRALGHMVQFEGWEVITQMLRSYAEGATRQLVTKIPPGSPEVVAAHAAAHAANEVVNNFFYDVDRAIEASRTTPAVLKRAHRAIVGPTESI
jgi:hypothetical protein